MSQQARKRLEPIPANFWCNDNGVEPTREWIRKLSRDDRVAIGVDLRTLQFGWPVGMPLCRSLGRGLHEMRCDLPSKTTARLLFCLHEGALVVLHGFIKKTNKTPQDDLALARKRKATLE
jgi:phage-related protein